MRNLTFVHGLVLGLTFVCGFVLAQARPDFVKEIPHPDLNFFEGKKACGTTATQLDSRVVTKFHLKNDSADDIFISDDSSVAVTDTKIATGGNPLNDMQSPNMNEVWCITDGAGARDLHFIGWE